DNFCQAAGSTTVDGCGRCDPAASTTVWSPVPSSDPNALRCRLTQVASSAAACPPAVARRLRPRVHNLDTRLARLVPHPPPVEGRGFAQGATGLDRLAMRTRCAPDAAASLAATADAFAATTTRGKSH